MLINWRGKLVVQVALILPFLMQPILTPKIRSGGWGILQWRIAVSSPACSIGSIQLRDSAFQWTHEVERIAYLCTWWGCMESAARHLWPFNPPNSLSHSLALPRRSTKLRSCTAMLRRRSMIIPSLTLHFRWLASSLMLISIHACLQRLTIYIVDTTTDSSLKLGSQPFFTQV